MNYDATESTDIRRALDRLQGTLEEFTDRYREVRRERRQMHEYIVELEREVDRAERTASQQTEAGAVERERNGELLERIQQAERRQAELLTRIGELEQAVRERESLVAEQEDLIQQYQVRFDDAREFAARNETARRELDAETARLREELELLRASEQDALRRATELESGAAQGNEHAAEIEALSSQLVSMRQGIESLESERAGLVANQARLADELEASRRSEQGAIARVAQLEGTVAEVQERDRIRASVVTELERRNAALESEVASAGERLAASDSDAAEAGRARALEQELRAARLELEERDRTIEAAGAQIDAFREQLGRFERQIDELGSERARLAAVMPEEEAGTIRMREEEREAMIAQIQGAIGVIDRYLDEA